MLQTTSRMISQLLVEMDALRALAEGDSRHKTSTVSNDATGASGRVARNRVFVLAATNALNAIDPAFLQPGAA
jgi:SpoVK/Ycf46/Vps4 family AAA+-type ATPase